MKFFRHGYRKYEFPPRRGTWPALISRRHVLISGPRGIGKSSLGSQLQTAYQGDLTLFDRCDIKADLTRYLCAYYACDVTTTLAELSAAILFALENKFLLLKTLSTDKAKVSVELDLKFIKAKIETEVARRRPATVATDLVIGLATIQRSASMLGLNGINVMIDELNLIPTAENVGHYLKIVHETLGRENLEVTFILAGQRGIYSRLIAEDPSIERLVRHVPISVLNPEEAEYVLQFAADHAKPPFAISRSAVDMLLALAAGYPYDIHLIGDAAFSVMERADRMGQSDILRGLGELFRSDKKEKYLEKLRQLTDSQRLILVSLARYSDKRIPMRIPLKWLESNLLGSLPEGETTVDVVDDLVKDGILVVNAQENVCQFAEELLRIFIALLLRGQRELEERRQAHTKEREIQKYEAERLAARRRFLTDLGSGVVDEEEIKRAMDELEQFNFEAIWEEEDHSELTQFRRRGKDDT